MATVKSPASFTRQRIDWEPCMPGVGSQHLLLYRHLPGQHYVSQVALVHARTYRVKKVLQVPEAKCITHTGWVAGGGRFFLISVGPPPTVGPPFTWTFLVFDTPNGALLHRRVFQETTGAWKGPPTVSRKRDLAVVFDDNLHAIIIKMHDLSTQRIFLLAGAFKHDRLQIIAVRVSWSMNNSKIALWAQLPDTELDSSTPRHAAGHNSAGQLLVYEAGTGVLLQALKMAVLGRFEWVAEEQLMVWGFSQDGREPYKLRAGSRQVPCQWIFVLHATKGVVSMTSSTSPDPPMAVCCSPDGELIAEAIGSMATGTPDEIQIRDASSGLVLHSADLVDTQLHPVECLPQFAARSDGTIVAFISSKAFGQLHPKNVSFIVFGRAHDPGTTSSSSALSRDADRLAGAPNSWASGTADQVTTHQYQKWKCLFTRKDPCQSGQNAELSPDGMSLLEWRPKWDCAPDTISTSPHWLTHVKIDLLQGDATPSANVHVDGTLNPVGGRECMQVKWAPALGGCLSAMYACGEANHVYVVDGKGAKLMMKWTKAEVVHAVLKPGASEDFFSCPARWQSLWAQKGLTNEELHQLRDASWSGMWWAPDFRALCCTIRHWVLIVVYDGSLRC